MSRYGRLLGAFAVVVFCVILQGAAADVSVIDEYVELVNTSFDLSEWTSVNGVAKKIIQHSSLTNGPFTIQGKSSVFTDDERIARADIFIDNISVQEGYFAITNYLPDGSTVTFSRVHGVVAANTPFIDASTLYFANITMIVKNNDVAWEAAETLANSQVLVRAPSSIATTSALFVLNTSVAEASSMVAALGTDQNGDIVVNIQSLIAIDYCNCSGCANGLLYAEQAAIVVQANSFLRVSHSALTNVPTGTPLINPTSMSTIDVSDNSLLVVENVTSPSSNVFAARSVATRNRSAVVLRYVSANSLGTTLDAGASYKRLSLGQSSLTGLDAAVPIAVDQCASACVLPATVDSSCSCTCASQGDARYPNFCTYVSDVALKQYPDTCAAGCAACASTAVGACTVCREGYSLSSGVCYQEPIGCPSSCAQCTSTGVCQECDPGYALSATKTCEACTASHCETCTTALDSCTTCQATYTMIDGVCEPICLATHCIKCVPANSSKCATCENGYAVSGTGTCNERGDAAARYVSVSCVWCAITLLLLSLCLHLW